MAIDDPPLRDGRFKSGQAHPRAVNLAARLIQLKALPLGTLEITSTEIEIVGRSRQAVEATCRACNRARLIHVDNLLAGRSKNCRCQRPPKYDHPQADILGDRYHAARRRCEDPTDDAYPNYGYLGIEMRFDSREEYIRYVLEYLPSDDYTRWDIDRKDSNGHYEKGNLQLLSRSDNLKKRWNSKRVVYEGQSVAPVDLYDLILSHHPDYRYSRSYTAKLAARGVAPEEIVSRGRSRTRINART